MKDYGLVVVGAGLAGCASALLLKRRRPRTSILVVGQQELAPPGMAEYLDPEGAHLWRSLGLPELGGLESPALTWRSSDGRWHRHAFLASAYGSALCLDRAELLAWLDKELAAHSVALERGTRVKTVTRVAEGWSLTRTGGSDEARLTAALVIDATGRDSDVGQRLGARRELLWDNQALSQHVSGPVDCCDLILEWVPGGWLSATPLPGAGGWTVSLVCDTAHPSFNAALRASARIAGLGLAQGPVYRQEAGTSFLVPAGGPGWLAVGEAGWALDPVISKGMTEALHSASLAAEAMAAVLDGAHPEKTMAGYLEARDGRFRQLMAACWDAYGALDPEPRTGERDRTCD